MPDVFSAWPDEPSITLLSASELASRIVPTLAGATLVFDESVSGTPCLEWLQQAVVSIVGRPSSQATDCHLVMMFRTNTNTNIVSVPYERIEWLLHQLLLAAYKHRWWTKPVPTTRVLPDVLHGLAAAGTLVLSDYQRMWMPPLLYCLRLLPATDRQSTSGLVEPTRATRFWQRFSTNNYWPAATVDFDADFRDAPTQPLPYEIGLDWIMAVSQPVQIPDGMVLHAMGQLPRLRLFLRDGLDAMVVLLRTDRNAGRGAAMDLEEDRKGDHKEDLKDETQVPTATVRWAGRLANQMGPLFTHDTLATVHSIITGGAAAARRWALTRHLPWLHAQIAHVEAATIAGADAGAAAADPYAWVVLQDPWLLPCHFQDAYDGAVRQQRLQQKPHVVTALFDTELSHYVTAAFLPQSHLLWWLYESATKRCDSPLFSSHWLAFRLAYARQGFPDPANEDRVARALWAACTGVTPTGPLEADHKRRLATLHALLCLCLDATSEDVSAEVDLVAGFEPTVAFRRQIYVLEAVHCYLCESLDHVHLSGVATEAAVTLQAAFAPNSLANAITLALESVTGSHEAFDKYALPLINVLLGMSRGKGIHVGPGTPYRGWKGYPFHKVKVRGKESKAREDVECTYEELRSDTYGGSVWARFVHLLSHQSMATRMVPLAAADASRTEWSQPTEIGRLLLTGQTRSLAFAHVARRRLVVAVGYRPTCQAVVLET